MQVQAATWNQRSCVGMGTKVQYKSDLLRENARDAKEAGLCIMEGMPVMNLHTMGFMADKPNGYSDYDREMLKRTMLEHEAVFQKQVYELHRLYRIQKNLMDELHTKDPCRPSMQMEAKNPFIYQIQLDVTTRMRDLPRFPAAEAGCFRDFVIDKQTNSPLHPLKESSFRSGGPVSVNNIVSSKGEETLDSCMSSRRTLDLQLPVDVYIASDEGIKIAPTTKYACGSSGSINFLNQSSFVDPEDNVQLTLNTTGDHNPMNFISRTCLGLEDRMPVPFGSLTNFNELPGGKCGPAARHPNNLFEPRTKDADVEGSNFQFRSKMTVLPQHDFLRNSKDKGAPLNLFCADTGKPTRDPQCGVNEYDQLWNCKAPSATSVGHGSYEVLPEATELALAPTHDIFFSHESRRDPCSGPKLYNGIELPGYSHPTRCSYYANGSYLPNPFSAVPMLSNRTIVDSSSESSLSKKAKQINHINFTAKELQSFSDDTMNLSRSSSIVVQNPGGASDRQPGIGDSRLLHGGKPFSPDKNGHNGSLVLDSSGSSITPFQLIAARSTEEICNGKTPYTDIEEHRHRKKPFRGVTFKGVKSSMDLNLNETLFDTIQDGGCDLEREDDPGVRYSHQTKSPSAADEMADVSQKQLHSASSRNLRDCINLNSPAACTDDQPDNSDLSLAPDAAKRVVPSENLIAPASMPTQTADSPNIKGSKKAEKPEKSDKEIIAGAARGLVAMSTVATRSTHEASCGPSPVPAWSTLCWFAENVTSYAMKLEESRGDGGLETSRDDEGSDSFEATTLKLKEAAATDAHWNRPEERDSGRGAASLLLTGSHRGGRQARKRRQRRDFQRDILPSIASLSRREVANDLLTIGGLMMAVGIPRRNVDRKKGSRAQARARARQRMRSSVSPAAGAGAAASAVKVESLRFTQPSAKDFGTESKRIVGWGKTTIRCRRPRNLPVGGCSVSASQT